MVLNSINPMKSFYLTTVIAVLLFICTNVILAQTNQTKLNQDTLSEENVIRKLESDWTEINQTRDIEKYLGMYAPEAIIMPPMESVCIGIEALRRKVESMFADTIILWETYFWTSDKIEISASGDLAYVFGINRLNIKTPNGVIESTSKGIDIWKKINKQWKCIVSIWNYNKPLGGSR